MEYWEPMCAFVRDAWLEAAQREKLAISQGVCIRTVQNSFCDNLRKRLDSIVDACQLDERASSACFRVHYQSNRRFNGEAKEVRMPTKDDRYATASVYPCIAIHDQTSPRWNLLAIECWDIVDCTQFYQMAAAKQRSLAYVGDKLAFANSLFLQYNPDGTLHEASLLRRSTVRDREIEPFIDQLIRCDIAVGDAELTKTQESVAKAKAELADIAACCGVEDVSSVFAR